MSIPLELGFWIRKPPLATNNIQNEKCAYTKIPIIPFPLARVTIAATIMYSFYSNISNREKYTC
jgi:hypothetical protein